MFSETQQPELYNHTSSMKYKITELLFHEILSTVVSGDVNNFKVILGKLF